MSNLETRAREYCSGDIKTELGPWSANQIAIRMADFARPYEAALRELAEATQDMMNEVWKSATMPTPERNQQLWDRYEQALASAEALLEADND